MTLEWRGEIVLAQVERAAAQATEDTVDAAVETARGNTPVLTGEARNSLRREGSGLSILWGYNVTDEQGNDRGIWIEIGANGRPGQYALRRAGDEQYPRLAGRIAARLL